MEFSCELREGHYSMRLPWKDGCPKLSNNYNMTLSRLNQRLNHQQVIQKPSPKGIRWIHALPLASHQGGIYESIIHLVRKAMDILMSDCKMRTLTDEGLVTLLKEIEYILNCYPLTRVNTNSDYMETFFPIMLLTGSMVVGLPCDVFVTTDGMRSSWKAC